MKKPPRSRPPPARRRRPRGRRARPRRCAGWLPPWPTAACVHRRGGRGTTRLCQHFRPKVVAKGGEQGCCRPWPCFCLPRARVWLCVGCLGASPLSAPPHTALFPPRVGGIGVVYADASHWLTLSAVATGPANVTAPHWRAPHVSPFDGGGETPERDPGGDAHPLLELVLLRVWCGLALGARCGGGGPRPNPLAPRTGAAAPAPASLGTATARPPAKRRLGQATRWAVGSGRRPPRQWPAIQSRHPVWRGRPDTPPTAADSAGRLVCAAAPCARRGRRAGHWRPRQLSAWRHRTVTRRSLQGRARAKTSKSTRVGRSGHRHPAPRRAAAPRHRPPSVACVAEGATTLPLCRGSFSAPPCQFVAQPRWGLWRRGA